MAGFLPTHSNSMSMLPDSDLVERLSRTCLLVLALALFLLVPAKVVSYGYLPIDDALRHSAYAVTDRTWGDIMLLNPRLSPDNDGQAGWHSFLRLVHRTTGWSPIQLVDFSVIVAFIVFAMSGLIASGNPPAWLLACAVMAVIEPAIFLKLLLGRPLFLTMAAVVVLNFIWSRGNAWSSMKEGVIVFCVLAVDITAHSSAWYLWAIAIAPLTLCQRWRSLRIFLVAWVAAVGVACLVNGLWNGLITPIMGLWLGFLQANTFGTNLVSELQPSGAPWIGLLVPALIIAIRAFRGLPVRDQLMTVDAWFVIVAWTLGLYVGRFWVEWGLPALAVWITRQAAATLDITARGMRRTNETLLVFGLVAAVFYVSLTVDLRGRYTNVLRHPMLWAGAEEIEGELPEEGGILYSTDMSAFYILFQRFPEAKFKYALAMEPGSMRPEDQKVLRSVQSTGKLEEYKPWFQKMQPKDRILIYQSTKPEWEGIEFRKFFSGWMGRKVDG
jgi:hypothetical protein